MTKARSNATAPNAKGTLVVGNGTDASTTLAVASTAGYVLTVDSAEATGLKWAAAPAPSFSGVYLSGSASQTISNTTETAITWDTEIFDTDSYHSTSTNTNRITIPSGKGGYYLVTTKIIWDQDADGGHRTVYLKKNGNIYLHGGTSNTPNGTVAIGVDIVMIVNLAVNDYIEVAVYQNAGNNLAVIKGTTYPASYFTVQYLGA